MKNLSKEEVRTAEEIAYDTWRKLVNQNWSNVAGEIQAAIELYASQFKSQSEAVGWISVKERPLITKDEKGRWTCTKDGDQEFIAAIQYHEIDKGDFWWIRHCVIEDQTGLCVVGDDDNEPAGWSIEDVEFWQPLPSPPEVSVGEEKKDLTLNQKDNHDQRPEG